MTEFRDVSTEIVFKDLTIHDLFSEILMTCEELGLDADPSSPMVGEPVIYVITSNKGNYFVEVDEDNDLLNITNDIDDLEFKIDSVQALVEWIANR